MLAEYNLQVKKTHSERLLPLIAALLNDVGLTPSDLDAVAVATGPGSFTGVRIGLATAKALGQALNIPLVGVPTLEALAAQVPYFPGLVSPILDARRQQVYNAVFRTAGEPVPVIAERAVSLRDLLTELCALQEQVLFMGDGVPQHREAITAALGHQAAFLPMEYGLNRAATVARLGLAGLLSGNGLHYLELLPRYLRRSEAEVKYRERRREGDDSSGSCN
jgi:tRNA threonylcarbamoyladenosine biosynthesis protein TsaB